jgi:hypothetical protein
LSDLLKSAQTSSRGLHTSAPPRPSKRLNLGSECREANGAVIPITTPTRCKSVNIQLRFISWKDFLRSCICVVFLWKSSYPTVHTVEAPQTTVSVHDAVAEGMVLFIGRYRPTRRYGSSYYFFLSRCWSRDRNTVVPGRFFLP